MSKKIKTVFVNVSQISAGDTIVFDGKITTVNKENIKRDPFMGITLFGDSFKLGKKLVEKVII